MGARPLLAATAHPLEPIRLKVGRKPRFWDRAQDHYQRDAATCMLFLSISGSSQIDNLLSKEVPQAPKGMATEVR